MNSTAHGLNSLAIGTRVFTTSNADYAIVFGSGNTAGALKNDIANSLMIGFNSNIPTLFVAPASGVGTTGEVCIGDIYIPNGFKLAVNGKIIAEEVNVKLRGNWPDTVFSSTYSLMPLPEVNSYIQREHHLPGVPSAQTMQQQQTFGVGQMETTLLQKTEENTLYLIQLQTENAEMKAQLTAMQKEIDELKAK